MSSKLMNSGDIIKATCPNCKKEVEAIRIEYKRVNYPNEQPPYNKTITILGCLECKNVFFSIE